jgi:hypothetical protein
MSGHDGIDETPDIPTAKGFSGPEAWWWCGFV